MTILKLHLVFSYVFVVILFLNQSNQQDYNALNKDSQLNPDLQNSIQRGSEVYSDFCIKCHLVHGKGDAVNPPLDDSDWLVKKAFPDFALL